jgi:hypothetical protein
MGEPELEELHEEVDGGLGIPVLVPVLVLVGFALVGFRGRVVPALVVDEIGRIGGQKARQLSIKETVDVV